MMKNRGGGGPFRDYQECVDFIKRVRKGEASAKYLKEYCYKRNGTVLREVWFLDKEPQYNKQWVVVFIHYADIYRQDRAERRERQLVSSIRQVNLRRCTVHRTEGHGRTSCYPTLMHGLYLQDRGFPIFRNDTGWNWYRDKISNSTQDGTFQIISKIAEAQMWFPGDPQIIR
mmetsp:Transcript_34161/g.79753  ORF Transcript_34161/g.79753 Transcript_34161/m.79753 type:complete len:172 (+) Transcript_34161:3153-3668(+)